jgi:hypothetical protein
MVDAVLIPNHFRSAVLGNLDEPVQISAMTAADCIKDMKLQPRVREPPVKVAILDCAAMHQTIRIR